MIYQGVPTKWSSSDLEEAVDRVMKNVISSGTSITPKPDRLFTALYDMDPDQVKVVVLGQDPYPAADKAMGRAFGISQTYEGPIQSSMENIIKVLGSPETSAEWRSLSHWAIQGVLLLNTRMTTELGQPMAHSGLGWEKVTRLLLQYVERLSKPVYLLWGAEARKFVKVDPARVVYTSHPCRYSANRGKNAFITSDCFNKVNEVLVSMRKTPIKWV